MKFSSEDCDLFSREIIFQKEQKNTKLKISGMIITICVLFGFCFFFLVYNFIYSFDNINEKIETISNILSFYSKSYDYNDINASINSTLYTDPYYFIAGKFEDYDNKRKEIGNQFYKKKEFCGNVGILGIGFLIIDTKTNKQILLNNSNFQVKIKYYNDNKFLDINDVSTYPCSDLVDKLGNETHMEILNLYQCFGFNVKITKQLNLIDNISTIAHENIDISIKSSIDNVYISVIQIEQKDLS